MAAPINHKLRGIKDSMPAGYVLGRTSQGSGPPEMIRLTDLVRQQAVAGAVQQIVGDNLSVPSLNVLANPTAVAAAAQGVTITQLLDFATGTTGAAARGTLLYRGAAAWALLAPGVAGQVLTTAGAGADPAWGTGVAWAALTSGDVGPGVMDDKQGQTILVNIGAIPPLLPATIKNYFFVTTSGALPSPPKIPAGASAIAYCTDLSACRIWKAATNTWVGL